MLSSQVVRRTMRKALQFGMLMVCSALFACKSGPPPKQYLLEPVLDPVNESVAPSVSAIGLAEVVVPAYVSDQRLASRTANFEIVYDEMNKWADSPDEAITRVLADRLRYYLEANVIVEPWPRGYEPEARIEVQLDKLIREETGGAELSANCALFQATVAKCLMCARFNLYVMRVAWTRMPFLPQPVQVSTILPVWLPSLYENSSPASFLF